MTGAPIAPWVTQLPVALWVRQTLVSAGAGWVTNRKGALEIPPVVTTAVLVEADVLAGRTRPIAVAFQLVVATAVPLIVTVPEVPKVEPLIVMAPPAGIHSGVIPVIEAGGVSVTVAEAVLVLSNTLVAVTVTVCCVLITVGAVYNPALLTVPVPLGLIVQVTAVLGALVTVPVNCWVCPDDRAAVPGVTLI